MTDRVRGILISALRAAASGRRSIDTVEQAILAGDLTSPLDKLDFDSFAWMEFCISIELQSRQELMPGDLQSMGRISEIEQWLRARI
jgi:hypothetical protein